MVSVHRFQKPKKLSFHNYFRGSTYCVRDFQAVENFFFKFKKGVRSSCPQVDIYEYVH